MTYEYGSESKRLELPNPYRLQNRLLWLCALLLVGAGVLSLLWARSAMQESALRLAGAPILAGLLLVAAGLAAAATAATRLRFFFGRGRPASLAPEIPAARPAARPPPTRSRTSCARAASPIPSRRARSRACSTTGRRP